MNSFSDLNIRPKTDRLVGSKIRIMQILNKQIIVHSFKMKNSKFEDFKSDKCLWLQIETEGEKRVLFTGSKILSEMIQQVPEDSFPFKTMITKEGEAYQFN